MVLMHSFVFLCCFLWRRPGQQGLTLARLESLLCVLWEHVVLPDSFSSIIAQLADVGMILFLWCHFKPSVHYYCLAD